VLFKRVCTPLNKKSIILADFILNHGAHSVENFALIFAAIFLGYTAKRLKLFPEDTPAIFNKFVIYISLPAMTLLEVPKLTFSLDVLIPVMIAWITMFFSALIVFFISKILKFSKEITGALMLVAVLGNTSFVGIPLVSAFLGDAALPYIIMYDQLGAFIAVVTYGTFVASYYSSAVKVDIKTVAKRVVTFPPFITLLLALCFMGTTFNPLLTSVLSAFSSTIVPLALFAVGLQLNFKLPSHELKPFSAALTIKLIISPFIAFLACRIFGWDTLAAAVSILESGMGPMIVAGALATMAGLSPRLSSAIVGYGILMSFLTSAVLFQLIR